jgi:hypothetical protein
MAENVTSIHPEMKKTFTISVSEMICLKGPKILTFANYGRTGATVFQ